ANTTSGQYSLHKIKAPQAWDISKGSASIIVAITDDAFRIAHEDLTNKWVNGRDVADGDNNTNPPSFNGNFGNHGTHVAGTVGCDTDNGKGIASIGWNIKIMPVKVAKDNAS